MAKKKTKVPELYPIRPENYSLTQCTEIGSRLLTHLEGVGMDDSIDGAELTDKVFEIIDKVRTEVK